MDLSKLNNEQEKAVTCDLGPVLVVAGAGSGKTRVLTMRYAYLIEHFNIPTDRILAITFTNKAANEMKSRLNTMVGKGSYKWVGTFHGICLKILKHDIQHLGRANDFSIIDDEDQITIFKEAYKINNMDTKETPFQQIFHLIDRYKRNKLTIDDLKDESNWDYLNFKNLRDCLKKINVIKFYEKLCLSNNFLDFNDLLIMTNKLFQIEDIRKKWANTFSYVLVDEFQDTNDEQYEFIKALVQEHKNLFVVGDPDQMIYSWRGAREAIINNFNKEFRDAEVIILDTNYRSTQQILNAANSLIAHNKFRIKKRLTAFNGPGTKPIYFHADSQDAESRWVTSKILQLINDGIKPENITILYRANFLSRNIEQALIQNGIRYKIFGGLKFYQRKEIKDIIAYLKALFTGDELSIKRIINVPKRGIGPNNLDVISEYANRANISFGKALYHYDDIDGLTSSAKNGIANFLELISGINIQQALVNVFTEVVEKTQYIEYLKNIEELEKINNVEELKNSIIQYESDNPNNTFMDYLQEVSLYTDHDEASNDAISLMTVHISKGLEFDNVFIIGLNEDTFPSKKAIVDEQGIEEERRIAYVAITRAKLQLYLSCHGGINFMYNTVNRKSRFIDEIGSENYELDFIKVQTINKTDDVWFNSNKKIDYQENFMKETIQYRIGDQIVHTVFGHGHVLAVNGTELSILFKPPFNKKIIVSNHKSIKRLLN